MMIRDYLFTLLCLAPLFGTSYSKRKIPEDVICPICDYVYKDDGYYQYTQITMYSLAETFGIPVNSYVLNMTSQKWQNESTTTEPIWWHIVAVHIPVNYAAEKTVFITVTGLTNSQSIQPNNTDFLNTAKLAATSNTITAAVWYVPRAPLTFTDKGTKVIQNEDSSVAYTHALYFENKDPSSLLFFPMTKAVIKTMDTIESYVFDNFMIVVDTFVLAGHSKRGHVSLLAAAIDDRVGAIVPISSTLLNTRAVLHRTYRNLGGWPLFHVIFLELGILAKLDEPIFFAYDELVDPYSFREYIDIPKLFISGSSDEVFLVDYFNQFYEDLSGEKKILLLENTGHFVDRYTTYPKVWEQIQAYIISFIKKYKLPRIKWTIKNRRKWGIILVKTNMKPLAVTAYYANSVVTGRRDFRRWFLCPTCGLVTLCGSCPPVPLQDTGNIWIEDPGNVKKIRKKVYKVKYKVPKEGYLAFYIKLSFSGPDGRVLHFTTETNIIPNTFPVSDCVGAECGSSSLPLF